MVERTTTLNFATADRNLWAPGAAIELGIDTGDMLIFDPPEATYDIDIGGSFLGFEGQVYFDTKFGLLAYAEIGEAGRFDGGIDIAVNVVHDAVTQAGGQMNFNFSDYSILGNSLSSTGFGLGAEAGIDFVIGAEFGFRNIEAAIFGFDVEADNFAIIDLPEERIELFKVSPLTTELPFDLGYGLELTLRVPSGANTEGTSNNTLVAEAEGISDTRFIELSADVDELILSLIQKIPVAPVAAVAKTLENTLFATFEFDLNDYVPKIGKGIFGVEATVIDIGASIGAAVSEEISLDFGDGSEIPKPDVEIALRSDNGTPDDLTDDFTVQAQLGDDSVNVAPPTFAGAGPVQVEATYSLDQALFTHSLGIDITGEFTIDMLQAKTSGVIGKKLGINIGPIVELEFPEGGFRLNVIPELYGASFAVDGSEFNTVKDTYDVYYSEFVPAGIDLTKPGQVQELIAFNEARTINVAASETAFSGIIGTLPQMGYNSTLGEATNNSSIAEYRLYQFEQTVANFDFDTNVDFADRDVIGLDARNTTSIGSGPLHPQLSLEGFQTEEGFFLDDINAASISWLRALPSQSEITDSNVTGNADDGSSSGDNDNFLIYKFANGEDLFGNGSTIGRLARVDGSVNLVGGDFNDVLVYFGNEGQLFDGGNHEVGTSSIEGDVFIANFEESHPDDAIEWDLRTGAVGQSGANVVLKLSGEAIGAQLGALFTLNNATTTIQNSAILAGPNSSISITSILPVATDSILRILVADNPGVAQFEVLVGGVSYGEFSTEDSARSNVNGLREIVIKDVVAQSAADLIEIKYVEGKSTEPLEVAILTINEQHEVNLIDIERFSLATGAKDDFIATGLYRDLVDLGAGDDTLVLTADTEFEQMYLSEGADVALIELETLSGNTFDRVYGGIGADEAIIRNKASGLQEGAAWTIHSEADPSSYAAISGGFETDLLNSHSTSSELYTGLQTLKYLFENEGYGTTSDEGIFEENYIEVRLGGAFSDDGVELYGFEAVSFEGSDTASDLALFTGGTYYEGGDGDADTFAAEFGLFDDQSNTQGILLNGFHNGGNAALTSPFPDAPGYYETELGTNSYTDFNGPFDGDPVTIRPAAEFANEQTQRTVTIDGFERLMIFGATEYNDILVGGKYTDVLYGDGGNDILVGGGSENVIAFNTISFGTAENRLYGGDGDDVFYSNGDERSYIEGDNSNSGLDGFDRLIFGAGSLTSATASGLVHRNDYENTLGLSIDGATLGADASADDLLLTLDNLETAYGRDFSFDNFVNGYANTSGIDATNLTGLDGTDDLFISDGGATYIGGTGDMDTFAADFSDSQFGITYGVNDDIEGTTLSNGVHISGMDRIVMRLGAGNDIVAGGAEDDYISGGDGADNLSGGGSGANGDVIDAGAGADFIAWTTDEGVVTLDGGSDVGDVNNEVEDRLAVSAINELGEAAHTSGLGYRIQDVAGGSFTSFTSTRYDASSSINEIYEIVSKARLADTFTVTSGVNEIEYSNIEAVDVQGSDEFDDLIVYQNGVYYDGGDRDGDADIFGAYLFDELGDLEIIARAGNARQSEEEVFRDIGNGTTIGNFERLILRSGQGDDLIIGGDFEDSIDGGWGDDIIDGGLGDDSIDASLGNDLIFFSGGVDTINGNTGTDTLEMGAVAGGYHRITGSSFLNGIQFSTTRDDLTSTASIQAEFADLFANYANVGEIFYVGGGADRVDYRNIQRIVISAEDDNDLLVSGEQGGILSGDGGDDFLVGLGGNDLLIGGAGFDRYVVGDSWGDDVIGGEFAGSGEIFFIGWDQSEITFSLDTVTPDSDDLIATSTGGDTLRFIDYFVGTTNGLAYTFHFDDASAALNLSGLGATPKTAAAPGLTLIGTDGRDEFLETTTGTDAYFAGKGSDLIRASAGPDIISGGLGSDAVFYEDSPIVNATDPGIVIDLETGFGMGGFAEGDLLISIEDVLATNGSDTILGSSSRNALAGGAGNDRLEGKSGKDFLTGDAGDDTLDGGDSADNLFGGAGEDDLYGGGGDDTISGGDGDDSIMGNDGDDAVAGGNGDDFADLGLGDDSYAIVTDDEGTAPGHDTVNGGADEDTIDLTDFDATTLISLGGGIVSSTFENDTTPAGAFQTIATISNFENAIGSRYKDSIFGDNNDNKINGQGGDDFLGGNQGDDTIIGGSGFDMITYANEGGSGNVNVDLALGTATDTFGDSDVLSEIEFIIGKDSNSTSSDTLRGDESDNRFTGNGGADVIDGRGGVDTVDYSAESTQNYLPGTLTPGGGAFGANVNLATGTASDTRGNADTLIAIENVIGSIREDTITGDDGNNVFVGGDGDDTLDGGLGFDIVDYSKEGFVGLTAVPGPNQSITINDANPSANLDTYGDTDTLISIEGIIGTDFADSISRFADFEHRILGGDGDDLIELINGTGTALSGNQLDGGDGNDTLIGNTGDDIFVGGLGDDSAVGGDGDDLYVYLDGADIFEGGSGNNEVSFANFDSAVSVFLSGGIVETNDTETYEGGTQRSVMTMTTVKSVTGSEFDDFIVSAPFSGTMRGAGGDDIFVLAGGSQTVIGGDGIDELRFTEFASQGVTVDVSTSGLNLVDMYGNTGSVSGVEVFVGTQFADAFTGGADKTTFVGGEGVDSFTGGIGFDVVDLSRETGTNNGDFNIFFDVTTGQNFGDLRDTFGNVEQFTAIDHFIGGNGSFDDFAGSDADETFTGGAGSSADDINGGGGIDTIDYSPETGGGNVTIDLTTAGTIGNTNAIDTFGHADAVRNIENVIGASGDDVIIGSALENMLAGVDGNDTLTGGDGDDTLIGGEGEDSANYSVENGGAGITARLRFDTVTDTFGATDTLNGIEQIIGTALADTMIGHDKDDNFVGGEGADYLDGAAGNDTIDGGLGADTILGFDGNDDLSGGAAADVILGEAGNDTIEGGEGSDTLEGGEGEDIVSYENSSAGVVVNLELQSAFGGDASGDTFTGFEGARGSGLDDQLFGDEDNNVLFGGVGTDFLFGHGGRDELYGEDGNDFLRLGDFGTDAVAGEIYDGGDGSDSIVVRGQGAQTYNLRGANVIGVERLFFETQAGAEDGDKTVQMNAQQFVASGITGLFGGRVGGEAFSLELYMEDTTTLDLSYLNTSIFNTTADAVRIIGTNGAAEVTGTNGRDKIIANSGNDTVFAGGGDDLVEGGSGNDSLDGQGGNDTLAGGNLNDVLSGGTGDDSLVGGSGKDTLNGGADNDTLSGGGRDDLLDGGDGMDSILGGTGDDTILGGQGNDTAKGASGADTIEGGIGNDSLDGGSGKDTVNGEDGNDTVLGGNNGDLLFGGIGEDSLRGGTGNDTLDGGADNDIMRGNQNNDLMHGGLGDDLMDGDSGGDTLNGDAGMDTLNGDGGADELNGGADNDVLNGNNGNDTLNGGSGEDTLDGSGGADVLDGGAGADVVVGGGGADLLIVAAGEGGDTLTGGNNDDTFDFETGFGTATITDFDSGVDTIDLADVVGVTGFGDIGISYGTDATLDLGGGDSLTLEGISGGLSASDFDFA